jgi:hypothetical protein
METEREIEMVYNLGVHETAVRPVKVLRSNKQVLLSLLCAKAVTK